MNHVVREQQRNLRSRLLDSHALEIAGDLCAVGAEEGSDAAGADVGRAGLGSLGAGDGGQTAVLRELTELLFQR